MCIESSGRGIVVWCPRRWLCMLGRRPRPSLGRCFGGVRRERCPILWVLFLLFRFGIRVLLLYYCFVNVWCVIDVGLQIE